MSMTPPNPQPEPHSPVETSGAEQVPAPVVDGPGSVEAALESATAAAETLKTAAAGGRYDLPDLEDGPPPPDSAGLSLLGDVKLDEARLRYLGGTTNHWGGWCRPLDACDPFYVFWADGDPTKLTPSRLYFSDSKGDKVFRLPAEMTTDWATPEVYGD